MEDWREVLIKMKAKRKSHVDNYNLVIQLKIEIEKETRKSYPVRLDHVTPSKNRIISPPVPGMGYQHRSCYSERPQKPSRDAPFSPLGCPLEG